MFIQIFPRIRFYQLLVLLFLAWAATGNAQNIESINFGSDNVYARTASNAVVDMFSPTLERSTGNEIVVCGIAADCDNIDQCITYDCVGSTCTFTNFKSEGSLFWEEHFEDDEPGNLPVGWTAGPGPFFWTVGFSASKSAPFSLEINGPTDVPADTGRATLPNIIIPSDGGFFSYYLWLDRSPAYEGSVDTVNDVLTVLIDGQLVATENVDILTFVERTIDLPAATYGNQSISLSFEWRSGNNSTGKVSVDNLSFRAHAPCDDSNFCTSDDLCTIGACGGTNIPDCDDSDGDGIPDDYEDSNGMNKFDPTDANDDPDGDTFSNFDEYTFGSDPGNILEIPIGDVECSSGPDNILLAGDFPAGNYLCIGNISIDTDPIMSINILDGAYLYLRAPIITLSPGITVEKNARLKIRTED